MLTFANFSLSFHILTHLFVVKVCHYKIFFSSSFKDFQEIKTHKGKLGHFQYIKNT